MIARLLIAALVLFSLAPAASAEPDADGRIFGVVTLDLAGGEVAVDWCYRFGRECGLPAAIGACRQFGYRRASAHTKADNVGRTYVLGDARFCNDPECDALSNVRCLDQIDPGDRVPTQGFERPAINGPNGWMRVDFCRRWGQDCGWPAADRFCELQGYRAAVEYARDSARRRRHSCSMAARSAPTPPATASPTSPATGRFCRRRVQTSSRRRGAHSGCARRLLTLLLIRRRGGGRAVTTVFISYASDDRDRVRLMSMRCARPDLRCGGIARFSRITHGLMKLNGSWTRRTRRLCSGPGPAGKVNGSRMKRAAPSGTGS